MSSGGGHVALVDLTKRFGDFEAVRSLSLDVPAGEFFSLLGPSGCGKTTTLRLIAGFERPTSGEIRLDGKDMATTPPHRRNVNTVFQSYALFPHLSVGDNVAFGLRFHKASKEESRTRVAKALALVHLAGFEERRPNHLSGGQQQRVALARALILNPSVLLLDEPLGALDAKLRKALQIELKALQEEVGITFIYVTHDQEEALTMSDRMAVMNEGRIEQVGSPKEVYEEPQSAYVADFIGASNLMEATSAGRSAQGRCRVQLGDFEVHAGKGDVDAVGAVKSVIRPERVVIEDRDSSGPNRLPGMVQRVVYVGPVIQLLVRLAPGHEIQATLPNRGDGPAYAQGTAVVVHLPADSLRVLADPGPMPSTSDEGGGPAADVDTGAPVPPPVRTT
jgi:spermidine/putrescine transport system ATP-binding protein